MSKLNIFFLNAIKYIFKNVFLKKKIIFFKPYNTVHHNQFLKKNYCVMSETQEVTVTIVVYIV